MVRADIVSGIKNAIDRGESLESAKQTLVNSGYSSNEVEQAVNYLTSGVDAAIESRPRITALSQEPIQYASQNKEQGIAGIIILLLILFLLLGGLVAVVIFRESIIEFLQGLYG